MNSVSCFLTDYRVDVLAITETWFLPSIPNFFLSSRGSHLLSQTCVPCLAPDEPCHVSSCASTHNTHTPAACLFLDGCTCYFLFAPGVKHTHFFSRQDVCSESSSRWCCSCCCFVSSSLPIVSYFISLYAFSSL